MLPVPAAGRAQEIASLHAVQGVREGELMLTGALMISIEKGKVIMEASNNEMNEPVRAIFQQTEEDEKTGLATHETLQNLFWKTLNMEGKENQTELIRPIIEEVHTAV